MKTKEMLEVIIKNALSRAGYETETRSDGKLVIYGGTGDDDNYVFSLETEAK